MDVKSLVSSAIPTPLIDSHLDCKLASDAAPPRSVAVVKNQPPTPTSPSSTSDPVSTMSEPTAVDATSSTVTNTDADAIADSDAVAQTNAHGTDDHSPNSAAVSTPAPEPLTSTTTHVNNVEHNPPVSIDQTSVPAPSSDETETRNSATEALKTEPQEISIKSEPHAEPNNAIKQEPKSEPERESESEPERGLSEVSAAEPAATTTTTTSKHKRMLSTVTEDREIKRPVNILTSGPEPSRAILAQNAAAAAIVRGSSATEQDQPNSPPRQSPGLPISPFKANEPPIALLSSSTISSTSSSNRRHAHILSEQRRRENINGGFQLLKNSVPFCKGTQDSKAMILKKAVEYIMSLEQELAQLRYHEGMAHQPPPPQHSPISHMAPSHHAPHYGHPQSTGLPSLAMDPRYAPSYASHVPSLPPPHLPPTATSPGVSPQHHHHAPPPASSPSSLPPPTPVHSMSSPISSRTPGPIHHGVGHLHHAPPPPPHYATGTGYPPPISRPTSTPPFNSHSVFNSRRSHPLPTSDDPGSRYPEIGRH